MAKRTKLMIILPVLFFSSFFLTTGLSPDTTALFRLKCRIINNKGEPVKYVKADCRIFFSNGKIITKTKYSNKKGEFYISYRSGGSLNTDKIIVNISSLLYLNRQFEFSEQGIGEKLNRNAIHSFALQPDPEICNVGWNSRKHLTLYTRAQDRKNLSLLLKGHKYREAELYLKSRIPVNRRKYSYVYMGFVTFDTSEYIKSEEYFKKAKSRIINNLMGMKSFKEGDFKKATDFYLNGVLRRSRADRLFQMAGIFENHGDRDYAVKAYNGSLRDYSEIMKRLNFRWRDDLVSRSVICRNKLKGKYHVFPGENGNGSELKLYLRKAGDYCEKLKNSALYFFSIVNKTENINFNKRLFRAMGDPYNFFRKFKPFGRIDFSEIINKYKYDNQLLINPDGSITEEQTPISQKIDIDPKREIPNYNIKKAFYGPVNLIGKEWQNVFDYRIVKYQKLFGYDTVVLEVNPVISLTQNRFSGKVWIVRKDGSVLKIEWSPYGLESRDEIRRRSIILNRIPKLTFVSEFRKKRGRLRFPVRSYIVESYVDDSGDTYTRIRTDYLYSDYRFFLVDMETTIKKEDNL